MSGVHKLSKNLTANLKFKAPDGWYETIPYLCLTNITFHLKKFSRFSDVASGICTPLLYVI